jgi:hypothetical protein
MKKEDIPLILMAILILSAIVFITAASTGSGSSSGGTGCCSGCTGCESCCGGCCCGCCGNQADTDGDGQCGCEDTSECTPSSSNSSCGSGCDQGYMCITKHPHAECPDAYCIASNSTFEDCSETLIDEDCIGGPSYGKTRNGQIKACDADGDDYCDPNFPGWENCLGNAVFQGLYGDCDDTRPDVNPGAPETCDGVDNNCDGSLNADIDGHVMYKSCDNGKWAQCTAPVLNPDTGYWSGCAWPAP